MKGSQASDIQVHGCVLCAWTHISAHTCPFSHGDAWVLSRCQGPDSKFWGMYQHLPFPRSAPQLCSQEAHWSPMCTQPSSGRCPEPGGPQTKSRGLTKRGSRLSSPSCSPDLRCLAPKSFRSLAPSLSADSVGVLTFQALGLSSRCLPPENLPAAQAPTAGPGTSLPPWPRRLGA